MSEKKNRPFLSIVIPVWNRKDVIRRCLDSVLSQDFKDYEIIAVDDGSDDDTLSVIEEYEDPRLRIISQPENQGVCAARHLGTAAAIGKWIVSLDSDDALLPGALRFLADLSRKAPPDVGVVGGSAFCDDGTITPDKPLPARPFGYIQYLQYLNAGGRTDYQPCRRREIFETISWPTDYRLERQFHLRVAKKWKMWVSSKPIVKIYTTSTNRLSGDRSLQGLKKSLFMAPYLALDTEEVLTNFGVDLKRYAPRHYRKIVWDAAHQNFLAGRRFRGVKFGLLSWIYKPWAIKKLFITVAGLLIGTKAWIWRIQLRVLLSRLLNRRFFKWSGLHKG